MKFRRKLIKKYTKCDSWFLYAFVNTTAAQITIIVFTIVYSLNWSYLKLSCPVVYLVMAICVCWFGDITTGRQIRNYGRIKRWLIPIYEKSVFALRQDRNFQEIEKELEISYSLTRKSMFFRILGFNYFLERLIFFPIIIKITLFTEYTDNNELVQHITCLLVLIISIYAFERFYFDEKERTGYYIKLEEKFGMVIRGFFYIKFWKTEVLPLEIEIYNKLLASKKVKCYMATVVFLVVIMISIMRYPLNLVPLIEIYSTLLLYSRMMTIFRFCFAMREIIEKLHQDVKKLQDNSGKVGEERENEIKKLPDRYFLKIYQ